MATAAGTDRAALAARLVESGRRHDFFQAMLLLEALNADSARAGESSRLAEEPLRLRSNPSLGFPATDIESIRVREMHDGRARWEVTLNFLGLTGVSSPLPGYFTDWIVKEQEGADALREFLAMFEHRLYSLFWRAWKRSRLDLDAGEGGRAQRLLLCLAGILPRTLRADSVLEPARLIGFAGLLGTPHRTAAGLRGLVSGYFGGLPVRITPWVPHRARVPQPARVGGRAGLGARLGDSALLGDTVRDTASLLRIEIGPLDLDTYQALLPGGGEARAYGELVRLYLPGHLEFQTRLTLRHDEVPPCRLGSPRARIGWLAWLGRPAGDGVSGPISAGAYAPA